MKNFLRGIIVGIIAFAFVIFAVRAYAQSIGISVNIGNAIASTDSQCPISGPGFSLCPVGTAATGYSLYVSYAGGAYQPLVPASAGVTSFNKRTGDVTLTKSDVIATGVGVTTTVSSTIQ